MATLTAALWRGMLRRMVMLVAVTVTVAACAAPQPSTAAPYAAFVMDARTGETLYSKNAEARLHPASLTKMLTLYIAFQAIESGEIGLDSMVTITRNAAAEPPSKLGLKAGQKVALRHLIRAAAIKSANDAATAIGEGIGGSEAAFAERMNRTAKALGMTGSTFRNANGLTAEGHMSTARDMTILGRRLFYDFPQYYNIFSRRETDAGLADVLNTNRRFLEAYKGADGIKTGFTNAAGFNLTASAERGGVRIIATVFGGTSVAQRNSKMAELLDLGFAKAPANAPVLRPQAIQPEVVAQPELVAEGGDPLMPAKTIRVVTAVSKTMRPQRRPGDPAPEVVVAAAPEPAPAPIPAPAAETFDDPLAEAIAAEVAVAAMQDSISGALAEALGGPAAPAPAAAPAAAPEPVPFEVRTAAVAEPEPLPEPEPVILHTASTDGLTELAEAEAAAPEKVTRISTSGGRAWGVSIGRFPSSDAAGRALMKVMLIESTTLGQGSRKVVSRATGHDANFFGLTEEQADLACRRLQARGMECFTIGPGA